MMSSTEETLSWTSSQVRRLLFIYSLGSLVVLVVTGFGVYWYASYQDIAKRMEARLPAFEESLGAWIDVTAKTFSNANPNFSNEARLPSQEEIRELQESLTRLISHLNAVPTPTRRIEDAAGVFRQYLSNVLREVGRYDGSAEGMTRVVIASQQATSAGAKHNHEIERYLGSALKRLLGAF